MPTFNRRPLVNASIVRNSSVELNSGILYIFCRVSNGVRLTISSTRDIVSANENRCEVRSTHRQLLDLQHPPLSQHSGAGHFLFCCLSRHQIRRRRIRRQGNRRFATLVRVGRIVVPLYGRLVQQRHRPEVQIKSVTRALWKD